MNRMAMGDHRAGAERQFLTNRGHRREDQQAFDVGVVFTFHAVGLENQVVSDPNRVEAISLGFF